MGKSGQWKMEKFVQKIREIKEGMKGLLRKLFIVLKQGCYDEKKKQIEFLERIASKSRLTEEDAAEIGRGVNRGMARRFREGR